MSKRENTHNYAIDLLRIISMLMVVTLHFFSYNECVADIYKLSSCGIARMVIVSICSISVNCYILISGYYFMSTTLNLKKILKTILQVIFYSVIIYMMVVSIKFQKISLKETLYAFFPVSTRQYWYVTSYMGVTILTPVMKKICEKLEYKEHKLVLILGFLLFVVYYNFFFFCDNLNFGGSTGIVWFLYLYFCGAYLYKYFSGKKINNSLKKYMFSVILALGSQVFFIIAYICCKKEILLQGANIFDSVYNSIFVFVSSILFFEIFLNEDIFKNINDKTKKIVSKLASTSFSVYLIHDNKFMRQLLWSNIQINYHSNVFFMIVYWLCTIIVIYLICSCIDIFRQVIFYHIFNSQKVNIIINKMENNLKKGLDYMFNMI